MEERRKLKRRYLMFYSRVFDTRKGVLLGYLCDLTVEGAMLISEAPIPTGVLFSLRMDLPESFYPQRTYLQFEARSIWCRPDIDPLFYNTGFHLLEMSPEDAAAIEQINFDFGLRE